MLAMGSPQPRSAGGAFCSPGDAAALQSSHSGLRDRSGEKRLADQRRKQKVEAPDAEYLDSVVASGPVRVCLSPP
jgi:hypothetical protein